MTWFTVIALLLTAAALACVIRPLLGSAPAAAQAMADAGAVNLGILRQQARDLAADLAAGRVTQEAYGEARAELERRVLAEAQGASGGQAVSPASAAPAGVAASAAQAGRPASAVAWAGADAPPQRMVAGVLALLVPLVAGLLYWQAGNPAALAVTTGVPQASGPQHQVSAADVSTLVQGLARRMRNEPDNADGWYTLARSYTAIGRHQDALLAYEHLVKLVPDDANVLADYADATATAQGGGLQGRPMELVREALALDNTHPKALALAGSAAMERGDFRAAIGWWEQMLAALPEDAAELRGATLANIDDARRRLEGGAPARAAAASGSAGAADTGVTPAAPAASSGAAAGAVSGSVTIAPELLKDVPAGATLFVFARATSGPPLPLAALRLPAGAWPVQFRLDDTMSMTPELKLSGASEVVVGARLSLSGSATPAAGDLEGRSQPVRPGASGIAVRIDTRRK